jgi:serine/threonine-protein kinase RsbT
VRLVIGDANDLVAARQHGRGLALGLGFSAGESTLVATAISELARNIVLYAKSGTIEMGPVRSSGHTGLVIVARDRGPGIPDTQRALIGGYSTSGGLGLGLSGVGKIVDELNIRSEAGKGTTVTAKKWLLRRE